MSDYPITAFPTTEANWINENVRTEGMTLRDYFAAKAMQGMLASGVPSGDIPLYAYEIADAMVSIRGQ